MTKPDPAALLASVVGDTTDPEQRAKLIDAHNKDARRALDKLERTVTQGDWLAVSRSLDMRRAEVETDANLNLLALAYVVDKRAHGASSIDVLLELTDEELLAFHGFAVDADPLEAGRDDADDGPQGDTAEAPDGLA